jgi:hypothetical protein
MDKETLRQRVAEQRTALEAFDRLEVDWRRGQTFSDRLADLIFVLTSANRMPSRERPMVDETIMNRWIAIRKANG